MGGEKIAYLLERARFRLVVEVREHADDGRELAHEAERVVDVATGDELLPYVGERDVEEPGGREYGAGHLSIGETERAGRTDRRRWKVAPHGERRPQRCQPLVRLERLPHREDD